MASSSQGLDRLTTDLNGAAAGLDGEVRKVVERGAWNIKKDWQQRWTGLGHAPALPYAVTYDVKDEGGAIVGEVGPDKDKRQGALGNIIEFGSPTSAPHPGGMPALDTEQPKFVGALEDLLTRVLDG